MLSLRKQKLCRIHNVVLRGLLVRILHLEVIALDPVVLHRATDTLQKHLLGDALRPNQR
jgi:hypothetical protein